MRFDSSKYRIWKKHQNEKSLKRRTEKKARNKRRRTAVHNSNFSVKSNPSYDSSQKSYHFLAPADFSIVSNPVETLTAFDSLLNHIRNNSSIHRSIFVDVNNVKHLTIDSLMYLLCVLNNLNKVDKYKYHFKGNYPIDEKTRKRFLESGFNKFVDSRVPDSLIRETENIQISTGSNIDTKLAKKITDFLKNRSSSGERFPYIYEMMIELMGNTWKHAYNGDTSDLFDTCWYCYVELEDKKAKITFMDTGIGIPKSIYKKGLERVDIFGINKDSEYIASALRGEERTETKLINRGKGLPSFVEIVNENHIQKLRIISRKGDVCVEKDKITTNDLNKKFYGTLYYWEVSL